MGDKRALVIGGTGAIGTQLVRLLTSNDAFQSVILLSRRQVELGNEPEKQKIEQRVVDFDAIEDKHQKDFEGASVVFCALGTTRAAAGRDGFYKVDHDYVVNCAKAARAAGVPHFSVVSSSGSNEKSPFLYIKTKGEMERDVKALDFPQCTISKPAFLEGQRDNPRFTEKLAHLGLAPLKLFSPTKFTVPFESVAKAMIYDSLHPEESKIRMLENVELHKLAMAYDGQYAQKAGGDNKNQ